MSKTNFTKVEEALDRGLLKLTIQHLFDLAESAAAGEPDSTQQLSPKKAAKRAEAESHMLNLLLLELERLHKKDKKIYAEMGIKKKELDNYIKNPTGMQKEDWQKISGIKNKIQEYRQKSKESLPKDIDDQIIEKERLKHINKRFNVNEKWLPLK